MPSTYWQLVKDHEFANVPDTYLDHLLGEDWFVKTELAEEVVKELALRKRSYAFVPDQWGKTLEDL